MKHNKIQIIIIGQEYWCGLLPFFVNFTLEYAGKKMGMTWNCMEHTSFWSMLVILL